MPRLLLLLALLGALPTLRAQPEIVPAEHPVYAWLHAQRVAGRLSEYPHEALPLGRAQVQRLLDSLDARHDRLDAVGRYWLGEFRRELFEPPGSVESVLGGGGVRLPRGRDTEKFLYHRQGSEWRVALSAIGRVQARYADLDSTSYHGVALVPEGVLQGNYRRLVGFYSGTFDGQQFGGDTRVLQSDPELAPLYYIGRQEVPPGSFDRSTASLRVAGRAFSAEISHARLRYGASFDQPLVMGTGADYFSFLRLGLDTRVVQYHFVHGALGDRSFNPLDSGFVLVGPERYLALHRIAVNASRRITLAFSEWVVYGLRGPELAYLNPLNPFKTAEHALWDRDNALFALEAVVRPLDGVEAYGTFLADDLNFSELGRDTYGNKWAAQAGLGTSLERLIPGALGFVEYTRINPFVYTHRFFLEGSFYNSYQHNGFGLGHPLGPNADQVAGGLSVWLPGRVRARAVGRYVRRGESFVDENGQLVNVGGDIRDGRQPPFEEQTNVFLRGERFEGPGITLEVTWEPFRGAALRLYGDYQDWDHAPSALFLRSEVVIAL